MKTNQILSIILSITLISACSKKPADRMVDFGEYNLHIYDSGFGKPTVIIEAGLGTGLMYYDTLQTFVSDFTRIISYDHAGIGKSTQSPNPRTLPNYVKELKQLLDHERIKPPYILVGHSMGGLIIRYYTHLYPDDVAGLVFIDHPHEDWFEYIRTTHSDEDIEKFNSFVDPNLNQSNGVVKEEWEQYGQNCDIIKGIEILQHIPVRMITAIQYGKDQQMIGYQSEDMKVYAEMQARIIKDVEDAEQIITNKSGHFIHFTEPMLVVNAIEELIDIYRKSE